jgi:hypothetical protein
MTTAVHRRAIGSDTGEIGDLFLLGEPSEEQTARLLSIIDEEFDRQIRGLFFAPPSMSMLCPYKSFTFGKSFILKGVI